MLRGPSTSQSSVSLSLGEHFLRCLTSHGNKIAQVQRVDGRVESRTFSDLLVQGKKAARFLSERGVGVGDTVLVSCGITLAYTPIMLGSFFIGAAVAPVLHLSDADDMLHMLGAIEPRLVVSCQETLPALTTAFSQCACPVDVVMLDAVVDVMEGSGEVSDFQLCHVEDPANHVALIVGSSGTSGRAKAAESTQRAFLTQADYPFYSSPDEDTLSQKVALSMTLPSWNITQVSIISTLTQGMKLVLLETFTEEDFLNHVQEFQVNYAFVKPPELTALAKWRDTELYDTSSLRNLTYGGSQVRQDILDLAEKRLNTKLYSLYGMTETMGILILPFDNLEKSTSLGKLYANVDAKVVHVESGEPLGPNEEGELCYRAPSLMKGYRNNPEATRAVLDRDGFYHSGDLGHYDDQGYLYFNSRLKDLIKYQKHQLSASHIEEVLLSHTCVLEAAVVGIPHDQDHERATAFVVRKPGSTVTARELEELVEGKLPRYKWVHGGVHLREILPKTSTGKILKRLLRDHQN